MAEVQLNRGILHRACVQMSSPLVEASAIEAERGHILRFVRQHAAEYPGEIARALVWRVVDTELVEGGCTTSEASAGSGEGRRPADALEISQRDRSGAWSVVHAVLVECTDSSSTLSQTPLAEKLHLFLPYLISYRWFSTVAPQSASAAKVEATGYKRKVIPASAITGDAHTQRPAVSTAVTAELQASYRAMLTVWKNIFRRDIYQRMRDVARSVERDGNFLSETAKEFLIIPSTFKDSLWRLRRRSPRPSSALGVLLNFGWPANYHENPSNRLCIHRTLILPSTMDEADERLDQTMHPTARLWIERLIQEKGGCTLCDSWQHLEDACPCELPFRRTPQVSMPARERRPRDGAVDTSLTYVQAVDRLFRCGITLPLRWSTVLDYITRQIQNEVAYEEVLQAFDVVRGAVTGPMERHAMWIHASYCLLPSKTVFEKPSDAVLSPTMTQAKKHFDANRRHREWSALLNAVETLDSSFRRRSLPEAAKSCLDEVIDTNSFFFCLVDGSQPATWTPAVYARVPEEVMALAPLKDILCPVCLTPFHSRQCCPRKGAAEDWDTQVARLVLSDNNVLFDVELPKDEVKIIEAMQRIDADDRPAKEFRKSELSLAVRLIHERRVPICRRCNQTGHTVRRCEANAKEVLAKEHLRVIDLCLDPSKGVRALKKLYRDQRDEEHQTLRDAINFFASKRYPNTYIAAIRELKDAGVPLAAARYSTDAVQGFLLHIRCSNLLPHLTPLRKPDFPEVCLYCDSIHHTSEECSRAKEDEEIQFLAELRRNGITLWTYLRQVDFLDARLPTDYIRGKDGVLHLVHLFNVDYGPDGIARQRFIAKNRLSTHLSQPSQGSDAAGTSLTQQSSLFGGSFSQLVPLSTPKGSQTGGRMDSNRTHSDIYDRMNEMPVIGTSDGLDEGAAITDRLLNVTLDKQGLPADEVDALETEVRV